MLEPISTFATLEMALDDSKPEPNGIVFGPDGDVYVSVGGTDQLLIFDSSGTLKTTIGTGVGSRDEGDLRAPAGVAVDKDGNVYVVETRNNRFQAFTESGDLLFSKGESGIDQGEFSFPNAIAISNEQEIYIVDAGRNRIQVFDIAGNFLRMWGSEGDANGEFRNPAGIAVADDGLVYIADSDNHRIQVFKSDGTYTTGWPVMVGEQTGAEPHAIVIDPRGIVYALADMRVIENYIVVSDMSGNYLDSWTVTYQGLAGIAITPDLGALFVTYSQWGRIEVFAIDQTKIP